MTFNEFETYDMNLGKAFILGMIYPKFQQKILGGKTYILASVNHNPGYVTDEELNLHFDAIRTFLREQQLYDFIDLYFNKTTKFEKCISPKDGFSILIENSENESETEVWNRIVKMVKEISNSNTELKQYFLRGCFDGRGSKDNSGMLSVDCTLNEEDEEILTRIVISLGLKNMPNKRHQGEARKPQYRIAKVSIAKYFDEIGFFSVRRRNDLKSIMANI